MNNLYKVGGSLRANHPTYVYRQADEILFQYLCRGEYCFVLNSRQMGKSSLRVNTARRLMKEGIKCISLDLTLLGSCTEAHQWYQGVAEYILHNFNIDLDINLSQWWKERQDITEVQNLYQFFELVLEKTGSDNLVIFIDEIDSLMRVNFKDDFFAFIRACYNLRAEEPKFTRLCFCLLGVAAPQDLISDPTKTPFNIGYSVELSGFTFAEAKTGLLQGLATKTANPEKLLKDILSWTGGQPFLTQKLCSLVADDPNQYVEDIEKIVQTKILDNWEQQDDPEHLRTIRDRLVGNINRNNSIILLSLYQQLLLDKPLKFAHSLDHLELCLTGLVVKQKDNLVIYSSIYCKIFNLEWTNKAIENQRPYHYYLQAWLSSDKDQSFLLAGEELDKAEVWAKNKTLASQDYQFLAASKQYQSQQVNKILEAANQKATKILRFTLTFACLVLGSTTFYAYNQINYVKEINKLEKIDNNIDEIFSRSPIKALIQGVKAGKKLESLTTNSFSKSDNILGDYPTTTPIAVLTSILGKIRLKNEQILKNYSDPIGNKSSSEVIAFSPDGNYIAGRTFLPEEPDKTLIQVWNIADGSQTKLRKTLELNQEFSLQSLRYSPDGEIIAGLTREGTIFFWSKNGTFLSKFSIFGDIINIKNPWIYTFEFLPDSQKIIIPNGIGGLDIWSLDGDKISSFKGSDSKKIPNIYSIAVSNNGYWLVAGDESGKITVWNKFGELIKTFQASKKAIQPIRFIGQQPFLIVGDDDGVVSIWTIIDGTKFDDYDQEITQVLNYDQSGLLNLAVNQKGNLIAISRANHEVTVLSLKNDKDYDKISDFNLVFTVKEVPSLGLAFHPYLELLYGVGNDGNLKTWNVSNQLWERVEGIYYFPNKQVILETDIDGNINIFQYSDNINNLRLLKNIGFDKNKAVIKSIALIKNGSLWLTIGEDGIIYKWTQDWNNQEEILDLQTGIESSSYSNFTNQLFLVDTQGNLSIYNTNEDNDFIAKNILPSYRIHIFAASPIENKFIFTDKMKEQLFVWSGINTEPKIINTSAGGKIKHISFSQDGKLFAVGYDNGIIEIFDHQNNSILVTNVSNNNIISFAFTNDNQALIGVADNRLFKVSFNVNQLILESCLWLEEYFKNSMNKNLRSELCN